MRDFKAGNGSIILAAFFDFDEPLGALALGALEVLDPAEVLREGAPLTSQPILIGRPAMIGYCSL